MRRRCLSFHSCPLHILTMGLAMFLVSGEGQKVALPMRREWDCRLKMVTVNSRSTLWIYSIFGRRSWRAHRCSMFSDGQF